MASDNSIIDQIVNGVLKQLGTSNVNDARESAAASLRGGTVELAERIVTADLLYEHVGKAGTVAIPSKSIITPAAWDVIKELGLEVKRSQGSSSKKAATTSSKSTAIANQLLIVVRHTDAVDRLWQDLQTSWRRELLGCPDDAAKLAISELSRGEASVVVILAEQSHRAACLANRNDRVKAAVARDAADVKTIGKQLRANVWCMDPTGRSWFELRNLFRAIG